MPAHCHKMVAQVAKAAAGELYEKLMGDNACYEAWKKANPEASPRELERRFVAKNWGRCLQIARATLTLMLRQPIDSKTKDGIMEALRLDATLMRGRGLQGGLLQ